MFNFSLGSALDHGWCHRRLAHTFSSSRVAQICLIEDTATPTTITESKGAFSTLYKDNIAWLRKDCEYRLFVCLLPFFPWLHRDAFFPSKHVTAISSSFRTVQKMKVRYCYAFFRSYDIFAWLGISHFNTKS